MNLSGKCSALLGPPPFILSTHRNFITHLGTLCVSIFGKQAMFSSVISCRCAEKHSKCWAIFKHYYGTINLSKTCTHLTKFFFLSIPNAIPHSKLTGIIAPQTPTGSCRVYAKWPESVKSMKSS